MRHTTRVFGLAMTTVVLLGVGVAEASVITTGPIEWMASVGGNGHFYELVMPDQPLTADDNFSWFEARDSAASTVLFGSTGHLVTVTSFEEDEFLRTSFENELQIRNYPTSTGGFAWIGLTDEVTEGAYQWVTGETSSYTHWASTEPNNLGNEDYVLYWRRYEGGNNDGWSWNDSSPGPYEADARLGYIVEFDGPFTQAVPEPASLAVWSFLAFAGIGCGWWKKRRSL